MEAARIPSLHGRIAMEREAYHALGLAALASHSGPHALAAARRTLQTKTTPFTQLFSRLAADAFLRGAPQAGYVNASGRICEPIRTGRDGDLELIVKLTDSAGGYRLTACIDYGNRIGIAHEQPCRLEEGMPVAAYGVLHLPAGGYPWAVSLCALDVNPWHTDGDASWLYTPHGVLEEATHEDRPASSGGSVDRLQATGR